MPQPIKNPTDCEIRSVIRFLNAKDVKAAEIRRQISEVYGENITSKGMIRKWVTSFKYGRTNVHDENNGCSGEEIISLVQNRPQDDSDLEETDEPENVLVSNSEAGNALEIALRYIEFQSPCGGGGYAASGQNNTLQSPLAGRRQSLTSLLFP
ncbi:hypothetical protein AVEN_216232-1 [Araneus ventricosus]|uniref:Mos1 transposase HTH domain-containing protein n=1 Tax=Araneus ventricosus TaxID=182803 RepID=A0A4Y2P6P4_ARAVE|nr:hypothetical protein AVEN_216232-1 [Araneus ventricosus]